MHAYPFCRNHGQGAFSEVPRLQSPEALIFCTPEEKAIGRWRSFQALLIKLGKELRMNAERYPPCLQRIWLHSLTTLKRTLGRSRSQSSMWVPMCHSASSRQLGECTERYAHLVSFRPSCWLYPWCSKGDFALNSVLRISIHGVSLLYLICSRGSTTS